MNEPLAPATPRSDQISAKLDQLMPLLHLLDPALQDVDDPVREMISLLRAVVQNQARHEQLLQEFGERLDTILDLLPDFGS